MTGGVVDDRDWARLVEQLRSGDCTPFLGAGAVARLLPTGHALSREFADRYGYPFGDAADLKGVMQYASFIETDPIVVKQRVSRELASFDEPDFSDPQEPHALLARLPIPVYLTTNGDDFMTRALLSAHKDPVTAVCPWYQGASDEATTLPPDYEPSSDQPLVYHLHGSFRQPASLVLTEQDDVQFLLNLARDFGTDEQRVIPWQVRAAMAHRPLLFLGYSLRDWSFRALLHGVAQGVPDVQRRRHLSVQLPPANVDDTMHRRAGDYLTRYFDKLNMSLFWGSTEEFCAQLADHLEAG